MVEFWVNTTPSNMQFFPFLQYCGIAAEMLEHALRGCSLLETLDVRNCPKVLLRQVTSVTASIFCTYLYVPTLLEF